MKTINYFLQNALRSARKGKFYPRPWKQLLIIILLNFECLFLTGYPIDKL